MGQLVDFDELADVDVGVNLGGVQPRVSEHLLDVTQVGAVLQYQRRHRVAEQMATAALLHAAGLHVAVNQVSEHAGCQPASTDAQEHFALVRLDDEFRARFLHVFVQPGRGARAQRQQNCEPVTFSGGVRLASDVPSLTRE